MIVNDELGRDRMLRSYPIWNYYPVFRTYRTEYDWLQGRQSNLMSVFCNYWISKFCVIVYGIRQSVWIVLNLDPCLQRFDIF
jgi:hypothetical protein